MKRLIPLLIACLTLISFSALVGWIGVREQRDKARAEVERLRIAVDLAESRALAEAEAAARTQALLESALKTNNRLASIERAIEGVKVDAEKEPCFYVVPDATTLDAFKRLRP